MARVNGKLDVVGLGFSGQVVEEGEAPRRQVPGIVPSGTTGAASILNLYATTSKRWHVCKGRSVGECLGVLKCCLPLKSFDQARLSGGQGQVKIPLKIYCRSRCRLVSPGKGERNLSFHCPASHAGRRCMHVKRRRWQRTDDGDCREGLRCVFPGGINLDATNIQSPAALLHPVEPRRLFPSYGPRFMVYLLAQVSCDRSPTGSKIVEEKRRHLTRTLAHHDRISALALLGPSDGYAAVLPSDGHPAHRGEAEEAEAGDFRELFHTPILRRITLCL